MAKRRKKSGPKPGKRRIKVKLKIARNRPTPSQDDVDKAVRLFVALMQGNIEVVLRRRSF